MVASAKSQGPNRDIHEAGSVEGNANGQNVSINNLSGNSGPRMVNTSTGGASGGVISGASEGQATGESRENNTMGIIEEEDSLDFSSSVRSQIPGSGLTRDALSSYHHSQRTSKHPSMQVQNNGGGPALGPGFPLGLFQGIDPKLPEQQSRNGQTLHAHMNTVSAYPVAESQHNDAGARALSGHHAYGQPDEKQLMEMTVQSVPQPNQLGLSSSLRPTHLYQTTNGNDENIDDNNDLLNGLEVKSMQSHLHSKGGHLSNRSQQVTANEVPDLLINSQDRLVPQQAHVNQAQMNASSMRRHAHGSSAMPGPSAPTTSSQASAALGFQQQLHLHQFQGALGAPHLPSDKNNFSFSPEIPVGGTLPSNLFQNQAMGDPQLLQQRFHSSLMKEAPQSQPRAFTIPTVEAQIIGAKTLSNM